LLQWHRPQTTARKRGCSATDGARSDCNNWKRNRRAARRPNTCCGSCWRTKRTFQRALSEDQLALFAAELKAQIPEAVEMAKDDDRHDDAASKPGETPKGNPRGARRFPDI